MFVLYSIRNIENGRGYIGQTTLDDPYDRWKCHISTTRSSKPSREMQVVSRAIRKHGVESFVFEPMMCLESQEELDTAEIAMIRSCGTHVSVGGYNVEWGGHGTGKISEEMKKKISKSLRGKKLSPETRAKIGASNRGKKRTPETCANISEAKKRSMTAVTREKIAAAWRGKKRSAEDRRKMGLGFKAKKYRWKTDLTTGRRVYWSEA